MKNQCLHNLLRNHPAWINKHLTLKEIKQVKKK